jgi:peptide-methionine (S)-S-oxide reductase
LGRWADAERLARTATLEEKQDAFVQAALLGNAEALRRMLALGVEPTTVSRRNQSHGTALHHAVWSGSLDAVKVLVEAGADLMRRDTIYDATPLGWAKYGQQVQNDEADASKKQYTQIAAYLREMGAAE